MCENPGGFQKASRNKGNMIFAYVSGHINEVMRKTGSFF